MHLGPVALNLGCFDGSRPFSKSVLYLPISVKIQLTYRFAINSYFKPGESNAMNHSLIALTRRAVSSACFAFVLITLVHVSQFPAPLSAADRYELRIPGNETVSSIAILDEQRLTLIDKRGEKFVYQRDDRLDSATGDFLAYWNEDVAQYLRWPVSNQGNLQIGSVSGGLVTWRESQMQVFGGEADNVQELEANPFTQRSRPTSSILSPAGEAYAAQVDAEGRLQIFHLRNDRWQHLKRQSGYEIGKNSSIALGWSKAKDRPIIYSVDAQGHLFAVRRGKLLDVHGDKSIRLPRSANLLVAEQAGAAIGFAVDRQGQLWEIDLASGSFSNIDSRTDAYLPNTQIGFSPTLGGRLFAIDRQGNLNQYSGTQGNWSQPVTIAKGYAPGGSLEVAGQQNPDSLLVASIDRAGSPALLSYENGRWTAVAAPRKKLRSGAPLTLQVQDRAISLSSIDPQGDWWVLDRPPAAATWRETSIGSGFDGHAPLHHLRGHQFGVDRFGRLIVADPFEDRYRLSLLSPRYAVAPVIRTRAVRENPALQPARIHFENTSAEELRVQIFDTTADAKVEEFAIPGRSTHAAALARYSGATVEETLLVADPFGAVRAESRVYEIPAGNIYHVVVWSNRVTSVYFDRTKNKGPIPDEESRSLVSLGVFPLPAGPELVDGSVVDVLKLAKAQRNPGAAGLFDKQ